MAIKHYDWKLGQPLPKIGTHSIAKHDVFARYIERYINILSSNPRRRELNLTVVDGFCGGGAYQHGSTIVAGSPLRLLRAVKAAEAGLTITRQNGFATKSQFFFIDKRHEHTEFLSHELLNSEFKRNIGKSIFISTGLFEEKVTEIIQAIKARGPSHRALFFLDQYGWSAVSFATIRQIFATLRNPEVLITFSVDSLIDYFSDATAKTMGWQAIELDPAMGEAIKALKTEQGQRQLIQGMLYKHIIGSTGADYYTPFFIRSADSRRSYWLLHLSKHTRARDEMARLHWSMSNAFVHPGGAGFNALGFNPSINSNQAKLEFDFGVDARKDSLAAAIDQLPRLVRDDAPDAATPVTIGDLFRAHCNETPLTFELVSEAVVQLRDAYNEIDIFTEEGRPRPAAKALNWTDQVRTRPQKSFIRKLGR
ncbi:three-Cys-motif partner protein TcmP [Xanthobacter sp. 91]|uniref:three-Cys-motif partner protein TcmP n=1 Tax=Xanthobacter sp. 91 TaxID=1117244 RepID=UPI0009E00C2E|nr:three-Cys-motif partner protein TcmP [Xanthobacter sp. 91]